MYNNSGDERLRERHATHLAFAKRPRLILEAFTMAPGSKKQGS